MKAAIAALSVWLLNSDLSNANISAEYGKGSSSKPSNDAPPTWLCAAIPGLISGAGAGGNVAMHGVDLRTGETKSRVLPTTYTGFMGRSADCSMDPYTKTWRKVPDLLTYTEFFESNTDASQYFTYSFSELAKYFETQHQGESFFGFYKDSSVKGFLSETVAANESAVNSAAASESGYVVELRYTPEMLRFFAYTNQLGFNESSFFQAQALLPESIATDADKQVYHSFIDVYGTHVGQQWLSGGGLATFEMTNMSLIDRKNESWAAKQSGFAIDIIIVAVGWSSAHAHGKANMSADFKSSSYSVMMAVGGNPLLLEAGGPNMLGWNASIPDAPAPFNTTAFINVSQLVVDETRRNNLQAVVDEYLQGGRSVIDPLADLAHSTCAQPPGANLSFSYIPDPKDPTASLLSSGAVYGPSARRQYSDKQQRRALHALREPQLHDPCRFDAAADSPGVLHRSINLTGKKLSELTNNRAMCSAHAAHAALKLQEAEGPHATQGSNRLVDRTQEQTMLTVPWPSAEEIAEDPNHPAPVPVGAHDSPPSRFLSQELGVGWAFNFTTGTITLPVAAPDSYEWNKTFVNPYTWAWSELPKYSDLTLRPSSCMSERFVMEQNASAVGSFYASETGVFVGFSFDGISAAIGFMSEKADWDLDTKQNEYSRFSLHKELSLWDMSFSSSVWSPGYQSDDRFMPEWLEVQEKYLPDPSDQGAEAAYRRIAHFYGTHVVAGASLGATCRFSVQYKTGFASHVSGHYRSTQFELILGEFVTGLEGSLDLGFNKASFQQQINETFRENTAIDWHCAGGDTNLLDPSNPESYALWLLSIAKQPVVIPTSMRLRPLYMYMQEPAKAMYMKGVIEAMVKESARQLESEEYRIAGEEIDARIGRRN